MKEIILKPALIIELRPSSEIIRITSEEPPVYSESHTESDAGILNKSSVKVVLKREDATRFLNGSLRGIVSVQSNAGTTYRIGSTDFPAIISLSGSLPFITLTIEAYEPVI